MNLARHTFDVLIYLSVPQTFLYTWFAFLLLGITADRQGGRILLFSLLVSLYLYVSLLTLSQPAHVVNTLAAMLIGLRLAFHELAFRRIAAVFLLSCGSAFLTDLVIMAAAEHYAGPAGASASDVLLFAWPLLGLVAAMSWSMHQRRFYPIPRLAALAAAVRDASVRYLILLIVSQVLIMTLFIVVQLFGYPGITFTFLFIAATLAVLVMSFLLLGIMAKTREETVTRTQAAYVSDLQQVVTAIRDQRQAFINQVQTMYAHLRNDRLEELRSVMEGISDGIKSSVPVEPGGTDGSPLAALFEAKRRAAAGRRIRFDVTGGEGDDAALSFRGTDLVRIIGNLIDNAFDEVCELPVIERYVSVAIVREEHALRITVENNGRGLPEESRASLFQSGFSTKAEGHSGIGLPIVADLVRRNGGSIGVRSDESGNVRFTVLLPLGVKGKQGDSAPWTN